MAPKWTVIVYMVADTGDGFYQAAVDDITAMTKADFDEGEVQVVVRADAPSPWTSKCWEVKKGTASLLDCRHTCLLEFVDHCVRQYRAENYLIVLWGHGEGIDWKQKVLGDSLLGAEIEGAGKRLFTGSESVLEVAELGKTLKEVHKKIADLEVNINNKIVLGFDACLMAMVEVYFEIHRYVSWAVAANDEIPDAGWPYKDILTKLGKDPGIKPEDLAKAIVDKSTEWYSDPNNQSAVSFSACNLNQKESTDLEESVRNLSQEFQELLGGDQAVGPLKPSSEKATKAIKEARDFAEDLKESAYVDLNAFCSKLREVSGDHPELRKLGEKANEVVTALKKFAYKWDFSAYYPQEYITDSRAVAICFPESPNLEGSLPHQEIDLRSYESLDFIQKTKWSSFWNTYWRNLSQIEKASRETNPAFRASREVGYLT